MKTIREKFSCWKLKAFKYFLVAEKNELIDIIDIDVRVHPWKAQIEATFKRPHSSAFYSPYTSCYVY